MYSSSQTASLLRELTCHMGSHSVTGYPADPGQLKLVLDLATPEGKQGWVDLVGLVTYQVVYPPEDGHPSHTNRAQRRATSFMRRTTLPIRQTGKLLHIRRQWRDFFVPYLSMPTVSLRRCHDVGQAL